MSRGFGFRSPKRIEPNHSNIILDNQLSWRLSKSRWFTRGWTLQELLAPSKVVFFTADWIVLGDRRGMSNWIADITRIHIGALKDRSTIQLYTIAQRMSWAATRETTRIEDVAYSLLGIFNIHIPLLYGEGGAAFIRLQKEIMKSSDDHSIFAWYLPSSEGEFLTGALATAPKAFLSCGSVVRDQSIMRSPFAVTNLGLSIGLPLIHSWYGGIDLVGLNCARELRGCDDPLDILPSGRTSCRRLQVWIFLRKVQTNIYQRVHIPASTVFLQTLYPNSARMTHKNLFIETHESLTDRLLLLPDVLIPIVQKSLQNSPISSGLMITLGWGTTRRFDAYEQAFHPGNFRFQLLEGRSPMSISHQLLCNSNFSLVFSVAWDQDTQPQRWTHSVFTDPSRKVSSEIIRAEMWKHLLDDSRLEDPVGLLSRIHNDLRHNFDDAFRQADRSPTAPIISVSPQQLKNLHGQRELLVDIIFRDKQKPISRPEQDMEIMANLFP